MDIERADARLDIARIVSSAWKNGCDPESVEADLLTCYRSPIYFEFDLEGDARSWNFASLYRRAHWRNFAEFPPSTYVHRLSPWNKPPEEFDADDVLDSWTAVAMRWSKLDPSDDDLWEWIDILERVSARLSKDDAFDEFSVEILGTILDMHKSRVVYRSIGSILECFSLPDGTSRWREWCDAESGEGDNDLVARRSMRPGEIPRYARAHQGVIPKDLRNVLRFCRTSLAIVGTDAASRAISAFDAFAKESDLDWLRLAYRDDRRPSVRGTFEDGTVVSIMGSWTVVFEGSGIACTDPYSALSLWIRRAGRRFVRGFETWNMDRFRKLADRLD